MTPNMTNEEKYALLEDFINQQENKSTSLIAILHYAQELFDYLPNDVQTFVAQKIGIPTARVYGVVSFYSFFTTKPRGKYKINICLGTACFVKGSDKIYNEFKKQLSVEDGEVTQDGLFSIHPVRCIGACGLAPVVMINEDVHGMLNAKEVAPIIKSYRDKEGM
ncbi:MAG: NAD(P)H-dependent oxidoreductase subunit E [Clostridia bacterium]|jgi:NADH-quinone oxidoreductase subunit E/NADP-reducing hydrogenase subunit HndA|nr:NAD(P)H-dependent oxidoreductase subunit E [Clostridia bacterium]MDD4571831.1 NAD(P)H-dependent oxidoreductase subunit E [Clostridia bacterium]